MSDKIFPSNKIIIKKPEDIISFGYVAPAAQQIFNYVIAQALKTNATTITIKVTDYLYWQKKSKLQGNYYKDFYRRVEDLKHTFIVLQKFENNRKIIYEWPLISEAKTTKTIDDKTEKIEIKLNHLLLDFYRWHFANVAININETVGLNAKYSYKLYEFLLYILRKKTKNKSIKMNELRRVLTAPERENNVRFLHFLGKAIKNINEKTALKVQAKIKTKNKKSLGSAEIKFINLSAEKALKQYEFLIFERDWREKNGD